MGLRTAGIHHITALVGDPQRNVDFYAGILGLRLVKRTVNFDAPAVYHLYFGNETGCPGTAMTFFPFDGGLPGRIGDGQVTYTTFAIPPDTMVFWQERLQKFGVAVTTYERFGEQYLRFKDPDGLQLELVERAAGPSSEWSFGGVAAAQAIKGFGGAVLASMAPDETAATLTQVLGLTRIGVERGLVRFQTPGDLGNVIDVNTTPTRRGISGRGTVHHLAWRAQDRADQEKWRTHVDAHGFQPTPIVDRQYFTAFYWRERGGILYEIATDDPGFARDEPVAALGEKLMLPSWLEPQRSQIEQGLTPLTVRVLAKDRP